jgi:hypothetical protein
MEETLKLYVRFAAEANFEVKLADVQAYAKKNGYDWDDEDEREEAIACWVHYHAAPSVYYSGFLGQGGYVALDKNIKGVSYEVPGESILEVKEQD